MNSIRGIGLWAAGLVWLAVGSGCAYASDGDKEPGKVETVAPSVQICPLNQTWALDMPGTRDAKGLDEALVEEIQLAIGHSTPDNQETRQAFAVLGTGIDALRAAHSVFTGKAFAENNRRRKKFPEESNVSVVFFSTESRFYVHLDRVERQGKVINIYYRFVASESRWTPKPPQLALIPLGKLPFGKYRVNVIESPMDRKFDGTGSPQSHAETLRIIANSFSFYVGQQPTDQGSNEEGGEIYLDEIWAHNMPETRRINPGSILRSLEKTPPKGTKAKAGFAVRGSGRDALRQAYQVIVEGEEPRKEFTDGDEISVVFFSYQFGDYVHLHKVERQYRNIEIRYRFFPHESAYTTEHLALIPLGKLPAGKYRINIVRSPREQRMLDIGYRPVSNASARRVVCSSSSFSVVEKGK